MTYLTCAEIESVHENNDFAEIFKNLARYRTENNFVASK